MKNFLLAFLIFFPIAGLACDHDAPKSSGIASATVLTEPDSQNVKFLLSNTKTSKAMTLDDLKTVHTKQLHLLVVDQSLSDYQHIHPVATKAKGIYEFQFTQNKPGHYNAYADITPTSTGKQEFVPFTIGNDEEVPENIDRKVSNLVTVGNLSFKLDFDNPPMAGKASLGSIVISKNGKLFTQLEPVMGAYAHIVAFSEDNKTVLHVHPMGDEPSSEKSRGGPELSFHFEPKKSGFARLFVQIKVDGQDVYAPFGINVQ